MTHDRRCASTHLTEFGGIYLPDSIEDFGQNLEPYVPPKEAFFGGVDFDEQARDAAEIARRDAAEIARRDRARGVAHLSPPRSRCGISAYISARSRHPPPRSRCCISTYILARSRHPPAAQPMLYGIIFSLAAFNLLFLPFFWVRLARRANDPVGQVAAP